jgi:hypothetical protein
MALESSYLVALGSGGLNPLWDAMRNEQNMNDEFKVLVLPGDLNDTPGGEDLVLIIMEEEFMRMWRRGQAMIQNRSSKGKPINGNLARSLEIC